MPATAPDLAADLTTSGMAAAARAVTVIVNGNASRAPSVAERDRLVGALRRAGATDVDVAVTWDLQDLAAAIRGSAERRVVLVGGDGSVHAAVNLPEPPRELALVAAGGANNVARSLRIPRDVPAAALLAVEGRVKPVDLIEARTADRPPYLVTEGVSVGFLAQARTRYRGTNSASLVAGARAGLDALCAFHPLAARVARGADELDLVLAQLFVANLPLYEFGLRVCPFADPTDALLDVVGIEASGRRDVLRMVADLRRGAHLGRPGTHAWRAARVTIAASAQSPIIADSEDLGHGPVELVAAPGALRLVRP